MSDIENKIQSELDRLEEEEAENLSDYMNSHPEEFSDLWTPTAKRWRNSQQARARNKQKKRAYERKKQQKELEALSIGLDLSLGDRRIKRIKVFRIQTKKEEKKEENS